MLVKKYAAVLKNSKYDCIIIYVNTSYVKKKGENMRKIICGKEYDTVSSTVVKKITEGYYGDPSGYEETLYVTADGYYFLYTNGGSDSKYPKENIKRISASAAAEWQKLMA